ncbi:hypothetical protein QVE09_26470 [Paenibacillus sp. ClWae2A]|uniref:hypothetical protein n=1 Tax=Paenibacillus sp. ClWae2A TaxID=3057177 RepID=UPI0028F5884B|nr:hypothetical protein [Paenibacillus sp. ClWae2A]MDT9722451.1 hypothetical protein [Paenibacillus sp. ClWae2A]
MNKYFPMLGQPEFFFINCYGSYLISALKYFSNQGDIEDIQLFLNESKPVYKKLDVNVVKERENSNPWRFQPIQLVDSSNTALFTKLTINKLLQFLKNHFNIDYELLDYDNYSHEEMLAQIIHRVCNDSLVIVSIDEFFNPINKKYHQKLHNTHAVLIKGVNTHEEYFEVIDIDFNQSYQISFYSLLQSFQYYQKGHISLQCCGYKRNVVEQKASEKKLINFILSEEIHKLAYDLPGYYASKEIQFINRGLFFNIKFVLIPFAMSRLQMVKILRTNGIIGLAELEDLLSQANRFWENMHFIMIRKLVSKDTDTDLIIAKYKEISEIENDISRYIRHKLGVK